MAKPPTCRRCGNPHWSTENCGRVETVSPGRASEQAEVAGASPVRVAAKAKPQVLGSSEQGLERRHPLPVPVRNAKPRRDRKAYMRGWMARRRAEDRAATAATAKG